MTTTFSVNGLCKHETVKAILFEDAGSGEEFWIPKSVIDEDSEVQGLADEGTLIVAEWWAEKEGLT